MNHEGQQFYYHQGNTYWWIKGKYNVILELIKKYCSQNIAPLEPAGKILDVGCGPGNMLDFLSELGEVTGNDVSSEALDFVRQRGFSVMEGDVSRQRFPALAGVFSLITLIDSLEHMQNDVTALQEVNRLLKPGGQVFISVPAYQALWGTHDVKYGHFRRYVRKDLKQKLEQTGFIINKITYFEPFFLPLLFLFRQVKAISHWDSDDFVRLPSWLNAILLKVITAEKYYLKYYSFPFGSTLLAVATKSGRQ